ncbi:MAG: Uma2 family endonuclease [Desulfurispora sp.]|uniref:Uma2 family endonuclease n=1 Tax=Desulfurispora sp. TaxID=3014275 RepID=UPI00404B9C35
MSTPDPARQYGYADWLKWEGRWELIDGRAYDMTPAPSVEHQFAVGELYFALRSYFQNRDCFVFTAPFDVFLSAGGNYDQPDVIVQPDIVVVCEKGKITHKGCCGAPAMVVEVLSPATSLKDYNEKFHAYERFGVREYWIADVANRVVHVYGLREGSYSIRRTYGANDRLQSVEFPELVIDLQPVLTVSIC